MENYADGKYLGVVDEHTALGYQKYNGLLLNVQRRSSNGLTATANYTLSKCMGLPTQGGTTPNVGTGYVDPTNPDYDYGPCDTDRRHLFNLTFLARTPDFSVTPDSLPDAIVTGSAIAAGVVTEYAATTAAVIASVRLVFFMYAYLLGPLSDCAVARSLRDEVM